MDWKALGAWGAFGLLVGIALVIWVQPRTTEGVGLLLVVGVACGLVLKGIWSAIRGRTG